jgi:hypothetical protein
MSGKCDIYEANSLPFAEEIATSRHGLEHTPLREENHKSRFIVDTVVATSILVHW